MGYGFRYMLHTLHLLKSLEWVREALHVPFFFTKNVSGFFLFSRNAPKGKRIEEYDAI